MDKIRGLQVLRGIAACAVVFGHAYSQALHFWGPAARGSSVVSFHDLMWVGQFGVDLFFVLSGFLMAHLHGHQFGVAGAWRSFLRRRLVRIVPLYWILSGVGLAFLLLVPALFTYHTTHEWQWIVGSFLFVPLPASTGFSAPILGAGWTLDYEMYFYALFALALMFRRGRAGLITILIASVAAGFLLAPKHPWAALATGTLLLEFLMGILTAQLVVLVRPTQTIVRLCLVLPAVAIAATLFHVSPAWRVLEWGLPCAVLVAGVVWSNRTFRGPFGRFLVLVGDASYSIYLFQVFALPGFARAFSLLHLQRILPIDLLVCLVATSACASGIMVWKCLEQPVTRLVRRTT